MSSSEKMTRTRTPGVYRRGDRYAISWRDANRKQRWGSARTYDDARALKAAKDREARAGEQHVPISQQPALADYARELFGCDPGRPTDATGRYQGRRGAIRK